jgi:hypothetical protein
VEETRVNIVKAVTKTSAGHYKEKFPTPHAAMFPARLPACLPAKSKPKSSIPLVVLFSQMHTSLLSFYQRVPDWCSGS